jgi:nucleotide-binding universal stress UspA family protein
MNSALVVLYFSHAEKYAKKWIDDVEEIAKKEKAHITSEIIIDVPSVLNTIIEYAAKQHADLIIMETGEEQAQSNCCLEASLARS